MRMLTVLFGYMDCTGSLCATLMVSCVADLNKELRQYPMVQEKFHLRLEVDTVREATALRQAQVGAAACCCTRELPAPLRSRMCFFLKMISARGRKALLTAG